MLTFDPKSDNELDILEVESGNDTRRGMHYRASDELATAINVALALSRPLLVSGDPGCGKTELGFAIARKLAVRRVHFFSAKSDSDARSLFYEYDALARFRAAQSGGTDVDPRFFIRYRALGRAILDAHGPQGTSHLGTAELFAPGAKPARSVVVIDEIDKAPRDFPNDLLNEIDQLWFRVPELSAHLGERWAETPRKRPEVEFAPIVIITSNNERQLPDAFMRRCVFHHIEFPSNKGVRDEIVKNHLSRLQRNINDSLLAELMSVVEWARGGGLRRKPGLAEVIDFASAAMAMPGTTAIDRMLQAIPALAKEKGDIDAIKKHLIALQQPAKRS